MSAEDSLQTMYVWSNREGFRTVAVRIRLIELFMKITVDTGKKWVYHHFILIISKQYEKCEREEKEYGKH